MSEKTVYLMRGLPSCGKSHRAIRLAGESGIILETDQFFYSEVGEDPSKYDYQEELIDQARAWVFKQFEQAIAKGTSPIVLDRGNGLNLETKAFAQHAVENGYIAELCEPDSPWWLELRVLLKYKSYVHAELLEHFANELANRSKETHRVPRSTILRWMKAWRFDLTIKDILNYQPN